MIIGQLHSENYVVKIPNEFNDLNYPLRTNYYLHTKPKNKNLKICVRLQILARARQL